MSVHLVTLNHFKCITNTAPKIPALIGFLTKKPAPLLSRDNKSLKFITNTEVEIDDCAS